MAKIFYDHLIKIEEITIELDKNNVSIEEKEEFISLIDETFQIQMLNLILDRLPAEFHEDFLEHFQKSPQDEKLINYLTEKISTNIEDLIKIEAEKIKKELLSEIRKSKKK